MDFSKTRIKNSTIQFGNWQFNAVDGQLTSPDKKVRLQPRLAKLLDELLRHPNLLLNRDTLIELLWQDKTVNEDSLSRCIAELRSILGDSSSSPIYIETVPKKGYRFIHPITASPFSGGLFVAGGLLALAVLTGFVYYLVMVAYPAKLSSTEASENDHVQQIKSGILGAYRLTSSTDVEYYPQLSNNGEMISYSVEHQERLIVNVIDLKGELLYEIRDQQQNLYSATFSPDDKSLLIAGLANKQCRIYRYSLPSLLREELGVCSAPNLSGLFSWSPDGKSFAYVNVSSDNTSSAIWHFDLTSGHSSQQTYPGTAEFDTNPQFSPDGLRIAFTRGTHSFRNIYLYEVQQPSKLTIVKDGNSFISGMNWLEDNDHLLFDDNQLGDRNLWLINTLNSKKILLGARDGQMPALNRVNDALVFQEINYNANIWQFALSDEVQAKTPLIQSIKFNNFPSFSPNGDRVAFVSNRQGKGAIWLYHFKTTQQTRLLSLPEMDLLNPSWSPDASQLLVTSRSDQGYRCYQLEMESGNYQAIQAIRPEHHNCQMAENGDIFAISKEPTHPSRLLKLKSTGEVVTLVEQNIRRIMLSDHGRIIYTLTDEEGLFSVDFSGNDNITLVANFPKNLNGQWTVQGTMLYYPKLSEQQGIWQRDLVTGEERLVSNELPSTVGHSISVSPDHTQLLLSKTDNYQADIYLAKIKVDRH